MPDKFCFCIPLACFFHFIGVIAGISAIIALVYIFSGFLYWIGSLIIYIIIFVLYIKSMIGTPEAKHKSLKGFAILFLVLECLAGAIGFIVGCVIANVFGIILGLAYIAWGVYGYFCLKSFALEEENRLRAYQSLP